jgi:hypothetical protein
VLIAAGVAAVLLVAYMIGGTTASSRKVFRTPAGIVDPHTGRLAAASGEHMMAAGGGSTRGRGGAPRAASVDEAPTPQGAGFAAAVDSAWPTEQMLIRTAALRLRVEDVAEAHEEVARIAREANGYVADTDLSAEAGPTHATMTIRVPAEGLDSVLDSVVALGTLLKKEISAKEVTEEYVDLDSRKRNLEREEERLLALLSRAGRIKDLLEVEQTLARVRGQVEQIAGRMRYLENRVALSTVRVRLEGPQPEPMVRASIWTAKDVYREATRSLIRTGRGLATIGIWTGVYAPVWLPLLIFVWLLARWATRSQREERRATAK